MNNFIYAGEIYPFKAGAFMSSAWEKKSKSGGVLTIDFIINDHGEMVLAEWKWPIFSGRVRDYVAKNSRVIMNPDGANG